MDSEAISRLLLDAATLLGLGMTFVFLFLALLIAAINLIAAFCRKFPGKLQIESNIAPQQPSNLSHTNIVDDKTLAVIGAAIYQYRKQHQIDVKD